MNPKLVKMIVKGVIGLTFSSAIGYAIKMEKKIEDRIDEHYDSEPKPDQDN